jgi:3-isopropylmalate dehydrogenase
MSRAGAGAKVRAKIVLLPGDGIGPEVLAAGVQVLESVGKVFGHPFDFEEYRIGGCAIDAHGVAVTEQALEACQQADAVYLGAVGGPKWDDPRALVRPEQGLLYLRKTLGVFANLRPVKVYPHLVKISPLRPEKLEGVDLVVVRELTGGLYFGKPKERFFEGSHVRAVDTLEYHDYEIERIADLAFRLALGRRKKVTSVDKANVLETSRLWRQVVSQVHERYPEVQLEHMLVDTAAMRLVANPKNFDVLVTENMFGDILTDEAAVLTGSMGMLPSASLAGMGESVGVGLYEPIHGSAPDIAGKGIANPIGAILSGAMMLRHSFRLEKEAAAVEAAVERSIIAGVTTADLGGDASTVQVTDFVIENLA